MNSAENTPSNSIGSRLLDGAERSLLSHGYKGASIRRITKEAGTHVASINYHFGSKKELFAALFRRRLNAIAQRREEALQAIEARAENSIDDVVQAYFGALFHPRERAAQEAAAVISMFLAGGQEVSQLASECIDDGYIDLRRRYAQALAAAAPDVPLAELEWRLDILERFALCAMAGPNACWMTGSADSHDAGATPPYESWSEGLISIIRAGIQAPCLGRTGRQASNQRRPPGRWRIPGE